MKLFAILGIALTIAACAPIPNTSRTVLTRPLFSDSTIGGPGYPVVIRGAENVGVTPVVLAQSLRFPPRLRSDSSFQAVPASHSLINHARLDIAPAGNAAEATMTFMHGDRRIGVGVFTLPREDFANPSSLGSMSATMISAMLRKAEQDLRDDDRVIWIPN